MKSTKCAQCGFVGWSEIENCKSCGAPLNQPAASYSQAGGSYDPWDQTEGEQKGLAIAALLLGILSFITFGLAFIGPIIGIILAVKAMGRVSREPWKYGGRGMAIAGLILSITSLATVVPVGIVAAIAIPNLLASRRAANEGSAISSVRTIAQAEVTFQSTFAKYGTLEELAASGLIDPNLRSGTKNGYRFAVTLDSENPESFEVTGVPIEYKNHGVRSFFIDETFVIRGGDNFGAPPTRMDTPLDSGPEFPSRSRRVDYLPAPAN